MNARAAVLADAVLPQLGVWRDVLLILGFSALTGVAAQFSIPLPFTPVPITGQTLAVLLTGATLGSRRGALAMLAYLAEGSMGLPVFAGGASGLFWTFPSGGYLVGFVAAAFVVGWLVERGLDRKPWVLAAMLAGNAVIYVPGLLQLGFFVGWNDVLELGLWPFVPGDLVKLYVASLALPTAWALVGMRAPGGDGDEAPVAGRPPAG